ncbi:PREDICTED: general transcription factor IIF subunit 1-like [Rhagoletis zephyria]|uniref:general transcription factor IIF subunit 1-like n=1 Tax=Rhagoletis zephyria TaxID=28612 RepID=UPI00081125F7|nr:PREDICTED: general transcription factor IIF subunit 1-like [Rhagoletis zephyria]
MEQEYIVRVPRGETAKQFNVLHFNAALNLDISTLKNCKMEREQTLKEIRAENDEERPEFGAGSEFGRKEREEARRKKYKGIREGGVTENTSYYVFFQAPDGAFEAFPVNEWYKFTPFQRYKALTAEEAEEKFIKRDQILNYFQLKHMGKKEGDGSIDDSKVKTEFSVKKEFKVTDMDEWDRDSENDSLSENSDNEDEKPKKGKAKKEKKDKRKKEDSEDDDEEPGEDSDEGDNDDKEVDYMSDSSSSSESDTEKGDIKAVIDESALRDLVVSEEEDEEENKEENKDQSEEKNDSASGSDFDSDNPDSLDVSKSALFIQKGKTVKTTAESNSAIDSKSSATTSKEGKGSSSGLKFKHKLENPAIVHHHGNKKQKVELTKNELIDSIIGDVRRYLLRKPYTAVELLKMCKNIMPQGHRDKRAEIMAEILKKLDPEKRKDHNGKMTFFLKPT